MHTPIGGILLWLCLLFGAAGCWGIPLPRPVATPPSVNGLTVTTLKAEPGDTVVRLSWQPVRGAAGYFVFRDSSSIPLNATPIAETHFEDIGLTNGKTYTYTVAPVDTAGKKGATSAQIRAKPKSS